MGGHITNNINVELLCSGFVTKALNDPTQKSSWDVPSYIYVTQAFDLRPSCVYECTPSSFISLISVFLDMDMETRNT